MAKRPKILILTARYGNGHIQVAKSLENKCKEKGINDVIVCDLFAESHPIITDITQYLYLKSFTIGPQFYRMFYYGVEKIHDKKVASWYKNFGKRRLSYIIDKEKPDIIINTFPMIVVPEFRKKTGIVIPTFNVLTDFCLHRIWIHSEIDKYYVATEELKKKMVAQGVPSFRIHVTGIPIRESFEESIQPSVLFKKYGINPTKKVVLLMAGAHGVLKNTVEHCQSLLKDEKIQVAVVCGKNETLREELHGIASAYPDRLHVFGYVERVDELFRISSCMVTKPGGITLSEASAIGLPVVLYKPIPGQEKENAQFFQSKGAAIIANRPEDVITEVTDLLKNEQKLVAMKSQMKQIHKENSSQSIIEDILLESKMYTKRQIVQSVVY
ncbi:diglucosyl diacylglycerol synthase [Bacillus sp. DJP31]|uniref:diglucosyl diacylglycerol synthase n=1 Tax=Bacillus sp. DJP31 TaxID=3409789 RepID=UPI003BB7F848